MQKIRKKKKKENTAQPRQQHSGRVGVLFLLCRMQNTHSNLADSPKRPLACCSPSYRTTWLLSLTLPSLLTYLKLHPNPNASVKYIEFEEEKVSFISSQLALAPSCQDQWVLGLSETFWACLWSREQPLFQAGIPEIFFPSNTLVPSGLWSKQPGS